MKIIAPQNIKDLLKKIVKNLHDCLGNNLVGIYLHGSLAMGSYNPVSSDIDFLIVLKNKPLPEIKKEIGQIMIRLSEKAPPEPSNGLEMSVVTLENLQNFKYPTPYELHFASSNKQDFIDQKVNFSIENTDPDLVTHFVVTKNRGVCLYGEPIGKVFPNVSRKHYLKSLIQDFKWSFGNLIKGPSYGQCAIPVYAVLNFCRVLAFIDKELMLSKLEGGEWALDHLPQKYKTLIQEALNEYKKSGTSEFVEASSLKQFAKYARGEISKANI